MLKLKKTEDLRRMYSLFGRVQDGHSLMRQVLSTHLKSTGALIIAYVFINDNLNHNHNHHHHHR